MRPRKYILFTTMVLLTVGLTQNAEPQSRNNLNGGQSEPTLSETVEWLKGKTDEVIAVYPLWVTSGDTEEKVGGHSLTDNGKIVAEVSNNCSFTWHVTEAKKEFSISQPSTQKDSKTKNDNKSKPTSPGFIVIGPKEFEAVSVSFPFSDMNPENIVVVKGWYRESTTIIEALGSRIPEDAWWVKLYTSDKKKSVRWQNATSNEESNGLIVVFRTEEMAQRFARALKHSVKLCGGKLDKKEPF